MKDRLFARYFEEAYRKAEREVDARLESGESRLHITLVLLARVVPVAVILGLIVLAMVYAAQIHKLITNTKIGAVLGIMFAIALSIKIVHAEPENQCLHAPSVCEWLQTPAGQEATRKAQQQQNAQNEISAERKIIKCATLALIMTERHFGSIDTRNPIFERTRANWKNSINARCLADLRPEATAMARLLDDTNPYSWGTLQ